MILPVGKSEAYRCSHCGRIKTGRAFKDRSRFLLTESEHKVASLLMQGLLNREIGAALGIKENSVKFHLTKMFRTFNVSSRYELIRLFAEMPDLLVPGLREHAVDLHSIKNKAL